MNFLVDINPNMKPIDYKMVLCKLNEEQIMTITNISNFEYKGEFVNIDELSFEIPLYRREADGTQIKNERYDAIKGDMLILLNGIKYFYIHYAKEKVNSDGSTYKEVQAYSREFELSNKIISGYSGVSRKIYDYTNSFDENGLEYGFFNYIEKISSWRVSYINPNVLAKFRALDFPNTNVLQSFQEVQQTFGCLLQFNTLDKTIDIYETDQLGTNQGLRITDRNFLQTLEKTIKSNEIKTRLFLYGRDNISIQKLSITGKPYIESYDFFKTTEYMSQDLIDALDNYDAYLLTKQGLFDGYLTQLNTKNAELGTKNDELTALQTELKVIQSNLDIAISSGQPTSTYKTQETDKLAEISTKLSQIITLQSQIDTIEGNINSIAVDTDMATHFTEAQARELDSFIREDTFQDSNYTEDNLDELLAEGVKILNRISQPAIQFSVSVIDFLSVVECQHEWSKFVLGDKVNLFHKDLNFDYEVRLVGYTHNPYSNSLDLKFSNTNTIDDANLYLRDLLADLKTTSTSVDFSRFKWDKGEQANSMISNYINSNLDLEKQKIMGASNQKPLVDERGIWLVKDVGGVVDNEQTRLVNNAIVMTKDGWNTSDIAISPNSGINANLINGKIGNLATLNAGQINVTIDELTEQPLLAYIDTELTEAVSDLGDVINGAFIDTQLTNIEANSIKLSLDNVTSESLNLITTATSLSITTEKTNYSTALTTLTNYLNTNWLGQTYPLKITVGQRTTVTNYFKDLEDKKSVLITKIADARAIKEVDDNAIKKGTLYNGVKIDAENGFVATRDDNKAKTTVNATEGIKIQGNIGGVWQDNFYVDTNGYIRAKNIIIDGLDSGNKTFNTTPTPPYKLNDLWKVSGVTGVDFRICTRARASGSYVASDWTNVTDSKKYIDLIKNLTSGTSIVGGVTTIDRNRVRVTHASGQYSEMRADGFIRAWANGESAYLNDIYTFTGLASDNERERPSPLTIPLPDRFKNRTDLVAILVPKDWYANKLINVMNDNTIAYGLDYIDLWTSVSITTGSSPIANVTAYLETRLEDEETSDYRIRFRDVGFDLIIFGY